jgi:hypothetical protein
VTIALGIAKLSKKAAGLKIPIQANELPQVIAWMKNLLHDISNF